MNEVVIGRLFDPEKARGKTTSDRIKYIFGESKHSQSALFQKPGSVGGLNSKAGDKKAGEPHDMASRLAKDQLMDAKKAARKVLNAFAQSLQVELHNMDKAGEGMVDTEDLMRKINERKIHDLKQSESQLLIAVCDTRSRGVVVISNFIDKM